jgi:putative transposase
MKTLRLRLRDKHAKVLDALARECNFVWNYCNELSVKYFERERKFLSAYDLQHYTKGSTKAGLNINSATVQMVGAELVTRRKQFKKVKLRWRVSSGSRKSLGWIPFRHDCIAYRNGQIHYAGHAFGLWDSYGLSEYKLGSGSFSQDARGRWYVNLTAEHKIKPMQQISLFNDSVGIDLGLKDFAATSDAAVIEAQQFYRGMEAKLAIAQRANKKQRVKAIHAKIAHRRKDFQHKLSTMLTKSYGAIFVGNVNASALAKTNQAKSVLDAGWSQFRTMLQYKCDDAGVWFEEINEAYSTQTCSACSARSGPKGLKGLGIREWICAECGTVHNRDRNAALNILAAGHRRLAVGIPVVSAQAAAIG